KDLRALFAVELDNVARGLYPMPHDKDGSLAGQLARMRALFADLPAATERRLARRHDEVLTDETLTKGLKGKRPRYYLQNFHFQTGGWLSEDSARIYDNQVEILFKGTANLMRRQALAPLGQFMRGKDQRKLHLVDIACGTGRFLGAAAKAFPRLNMTGIDLSESYLGEAARHLTRRSKVGFVLANGENLPFADASMDCVNTSFLFHELPPKVRKTVAREIKRVLKPGGIYIHLDSLQLGDAPAYDGLLDAFPHYFHEPYHGSYIREDLGALFGDVGLERKEERVVFVSKLAVFG
ncbi:MAG: class I SAM-dependent methyltransferase, partial [Fimbriimonadaceae bacterium]|nr:class I SAM-dependent methyltransferase [Alphaproteobacteria bacterium]